MSFYEYYLENKDIDFEYLFRNVDESEIISILNKDNIDKYDFIKLLSPSAEKYLELIAQKAYKLSLQYFGKAVLLYTPIYIANQCVNKCAYCSYNIDNKISRKKLTLEEIDIEAKKISYTGLKHILLLTGESKKDIPISYILDAVKVLKKYFDSVTLEVFPLTQEEYKQAVEAGVDGVTVYQEVYDEEIYDRVHIAGPKKNYRFRLDTPERACKENIRTVNIGALLGLNDWRKEAFMTGIHCRYLQNKYPSVEYSISLPRIRPHVGSFNGIVEVNDKNLVQIMLALRIFLPQVGITMSTREKKEFKDKLIPLGVTKISAGVSTEVGGHSLTDKGDSQFEIIDNRNVDETRRDILALGYQPIFKNWMSI